MIGMICKQLTGRERVAEFLTSQQARVVGKVGKLRKLGTPLEVFSPSTPQSPQSPQSPHPPIPPIPPSSMRVGEKSGGSAPI